MREGLHDRQSFEITFGESHWLSQSINQFLIDACEQIPQDVLDQSEIYRRAGAEAMNLALSAGRSKAIDLIIKHYYLSPATFGGGFNFNDVRSRSKALSWGTMTVSPTVGAKAGGGRYEMHLQFEGEHGFLNKFGLDPRVDNSTRTDTVSVQFKKGGKKHTLSTAFIRTPVHRVKPRKGRRWSENAGSPYKQMDKVKDYPKRSVFVVSQRARVKKSETSLRFKKIGGGMFLDKDAEQLRQLQGPRVDQMALSGVTPGKEHSIAKEVAASMLIAFENNIEKALEHAVSTWGSR